MTQPPFTDEEYRLFSEWLAAEFGIWFGPEKREILRTRLDALRAELGQAMFRDLFFHLKFHPNRESEKERLVPLLTNNESYFFRERHQLEHLRTELLPELKAKLAARGPTKLRMLSAGCAYGQEPYTLSIVAHQAGVPCDRVGLEVTGFDIDPVAVERARRARFTDYSFRGVEPEIRTRYFEPVSGGEWEVTPSVRSRVKLEVRNLANPGWADALPRQHVIFCRNVLIYFSREAIAIAARGLHDALVPGGVLFLGHAETLRHVATPLIPERRVGLIYYRRPEEDRGGGSSPSAQPLPRESGDPA